MGPRAIEMPVATSMKKLFGLPDAQELGRICVALGLSRNDLMSQKMVLQALRAVVDAFDGLDIPDAKRDDAMIKARAVLKLAGQ